MDTHPPPVGYPPNPAMMHRMNPPMFQPPYPVYGLVQPAPAYRPLESRDLRLDIRQQPKEALVAVEGKEKGRKPVDPPPFVQLLVDQNADPASVFLSSPYLFCAVSLYDRTGRTPLHSGKALTGTLVSSLHRVKDTDNNDGGFFVFGDISVKIPGEHVLCFTLYDYRKEEGAAVKLCQGFSDPFKVVTQKEFRGLDESTYLSRAFSDQGIRLRLRKEPRAFGSKRGYKETVESTEHADADSSFVTDFNTHSPEERAVKRTRTGSSNQYFPGSSGLSRDWPLSDSRETPGQTFSQMPQLGEPFGSSRQPYPDIDWANPANWPTGDVHTSGGIPGPGMTSSSTPNPGRFSSADGFNVPQSVTNTPRSMGMGQGLSSMANLRPNNMAFSPSSNPGYPGGPGQPYTPPPGGYGSYNNDHGLAAETLTSLQMNTARHPAGLPQSYSRPEDEEAIGSLDSPQVDDDWGLKLTGHADA